MPDTDFFLIYIHIPFISGPDLATPIATATQRAIILYDIFEYKRESSTIDEFGIFTENRPSRNLF